MDANDSRTELIDLLARRAYEAREVRLSSGASSKYYIDCKRVTYDPRGARLTGEAVWQVVRAYDVVGIGGLTLGADAVVAHATDAAWRGGAELHGFIVRKEPKKHGLSKWIEGVELDAGSRVAIVDDVVTSGNSVLQAVDRAEERGLIVAVVVPLVDREEGAREAIEGRGLRFHPVCTVSEVRAAFERSRTEAYA